jgi:hypothetical protein
MADIPPNILGSAAQAGFQQAEVSKSRDAQKSADVSAARREARAIEEAGSTVGASEEDVAVFSDSEGLGGQGRPHDEPGEEGHEDDETGAESRNGISTDEDGQEHLDIQA